MLRFSLRCLLLVVGLGFLSPIFAQEEGQVCFYSERNYEGTRFCTRGDVYPLPAVRLGQIASFQAEEHMVVGLYYNRSSASSLDADDLSTDVNNIRVWFSQGGNKTSVGGNVNGKALAVRIYDTRDHQVCLYQGYNFTGGEQCVSESKSSLSAAWDNNISSLRSFGSTIMQIELYEDTAFSGKQQTIAQRSDRDYFTKNVSGQLINKVSSYRVVTSGDSDGDGISDVDELAWGLSPNVPLSEEDVFANGVTALGHCDDDKQILHVLNRTTFGPTYALYKELKGSTDCGRGNNTREEDTAKVNDNIGKWIRKQFGTQGIPGEAERRAADNGAGAILQVDDPSAGYYLTTAPATGNSDVVSDEAFCHRLVEPSLTNEAQHCDYQADPGQCLRDHFATVRHGDAIAGEFSAVRPIHSSQHLRARLAWFWDNHFNTDITDSVLSNAFHGNLEYYEEDTFFMGAFGNFSKLVVANAQSPTMLYYLNTVDNVFISDPDNPSVSTVPPNENYARELLELHTMGADNGYDQDDVVQLARILTGWGASYDKYNQRSRYAHLRHGTLDLPDIGKDGLAFHYFGDGDSRNDTIRCAYKLDTSESTGYEFIFNEKEHDPGRKELSLGGDSGYPEETAAYTYNPNNGEREGVKALEFISKRPETADFICDKLAKFYVSDKPSQATIDSCAATFNNNKNGNNQIRESLYSLLGVTTSSIESGASGTEFFQAASHRNKYKDMFEYSYSLARMLGMSAETRNNINRNKYGGIGMALNGELSLRPHAYPAPDGRPETMDKLASSEEVINRKRFNRTMLELYKSKRDLFVIGSTEDGQAIERFFEETVGLNQVNDLQGKRIKAAAYLLNMMYGAYYDAYDIDLARQILEAESDDSSLSDVEQLYSNVENLIYAMSGSYKFSLQ